MTYTAYSFSMISTETGDLIGVGLACLDARYAAVLWNGAEGIERLHVTPADWELVGQELALGIAPGPVPTDGALYMLMAGEHGGYAIVQWVGGLPVDAESREAVAEKVDARLREIATAEHEKS